MEPGRWMTDQEHVVWTHQPVPSWGPTHRHLRQGAPSHEETWEHLLQCWPGAPTLTQAPPSPDSGVPSWVF